MSLSTSFRRQYTNKIKKIIKKKQTSITNLIIADFKFLVSNICLKYISIIFALLLSLAMVCLFRCYVVYKSYTTKSHNSLVFFNYFLLVNLIVMDLFTFYTSDRLLFLEISFILLKLILWKEHKENKGFTIKKEKIRGNKSKVLVLLRKLQLYLFFYLLLFLKKV